MDYIFFKEDSKDWGYVWDELRKHPINEGLEEPCIGLNNLMVWEYMGSFKNGNSIITEFRHLQHPKTNSVYKFTLQHNLIDKDSIGKSSRIK